MKSRISSKAKAKATPCKSNELNTDIKLDVDIRDIRVVHNHEDGHVASRLVPDESSWTVHMHLQWTFYPL